MNSFGAYWASLATLSVPFVLILDGTDAAIAGFTAVAAALELGAVLDDEVVLLLLPQPANASSASTSAVLPTHCLLIEMSLRGVEVPAAPVGRSISSRRSTGRIRSLPRGPFCRRFPRSRQRVR